MRECKHQMKSGCAYCHKNAAAALNGSMAHTTEAQRAKRAERYAAKLQRKMTQGYDWPPQHKPISRSEARWTFNQYGGN